jgi:F-type H+-transporting ATPase subunit b
MSEILNILGSVGFNWHVALANFINFLIILFLLNKFFFGKIGKVIDARRTVIERGLSQASDAERALSHAQAEKEEIIAAAHKESKNIVAKASATAEEIATSITAEAADKAHTLIEGLKERELGLKESVERAFGERAPELVAKLYAKTLEKEMTDTDNNALIARMSA